MADNLKNISRREFLKRGARGAGLLAAAGVLGALRLHANEHEGSVWQIDPAKCVSCEKCATDCVLKPSAVKAVHAFAMCGYCELCFGFFQAQPNGLNTGAENQLCPTDAIRRKYVEDPYYQYQIDEPLCIGCGRCVKGCNSFGNGSLFLQIRHDRCVNCNQCAIASACPTEAIVRVSVSEPYLLKDPNKKG